jgi:RimJ/RimL family protein N-acetyltransferase/uncharacterized protein YciI
MKFVALFGNGPSWQRGKSVYEQEAAIEGHLESMRDRFDEGSLLLGGPFEEGGGIAVLEACDAAAAARLLEADPAVRAGVLSFELHRLHAYFDAYASVRADMSVAELAAQRREGSISTDAGRLRATQTTDDPRVLNYELRTARLRLRPATADDADATWRYRQLDSVNEWLSGAAADIEAYRALFTDPARLASTVIVQLADTEANGVIGDFMLRREDAWAQTEVAEQARGAQAEVGWVLDPTFTGHGYATEAVRELLRHCFEDLGVRRVVANCFLDNADSLRLMQRVGMRRETYAIRESLHRSGRWLDTVVYAVLVDEYRR